VHETGDVAVPGDDLTGAGGDGAVRKRARSTVGRKPPRPRPLLGRLGRFGLWATARMPRSVSYGLGGFLGSVASYLPTRERLATRVNLELCFPELSPAERRRLARRSFAEAGRYIHEMGAVWCWDAERTLGLIESVEGEERMRAAIAKGKGVIAVTPHLGSWELAGGFLASRYPTVALYRPPRVRELEELFSHARERIGAKLGPASAGAVRALHRALRNGEVAGMLPDQGPGRGAGVFVRVGGHPANTSTLLPRLASRSGAAVVIGYAERLPGGRFRVHIREGSAEIGDPDPVVGAAALNRDVERCVRETPEQYLWSYKRFRWQPDRSYDPYKAPRNPAGVVS
jgi:KDO2-lipid IV(A) lauroyltransferase